LSFAIYPRYGIRTSLPVASWCNGSTSDSGSLCHGSNPCEAAIRRARGLLRAYQAPIRLVLGRKKAITQARRIACHEQALGASNGLVAVHCRHSTVCKIGAFETRRSRIPLNPRTATGCPWAGIRLHPRLLRRRIVHRKRWRLAGPAETTRWRKRSEVYTMIPAHASFTSKGRSQGCQHSRARAS
jgi:hypothetical protein